MDEVRSDSSSSKLVALWSEYNTDYYRRLYPKPIYPYSKPMSYSQPLCFYGDPVRSTHDLDAELKYKDLYNLKLDLDSDFDQLLNV